MKNDNLLEIFSVLSKAIIVVPMLVIVVALVIKFNQTPQTEKLLPTPTISSPTVKPTAAKINFNLNGPLVCEGKLEEASVSAYIHNKKIKVAIDKDNQIENILINGDCFYNWEEGEFSGKRICQLSTLISVAEMMANVGVVNPELLFNQLNNFGINNPVATDQATIKKLVNTCKQKKIDEKIFIVPTNILFRNNQ